MYVHVAAVIAACIVCSILFVFVIVTMAMEELVPKLAKPVPEQVRLKEGGVCPTC